MCNVCILLSGIAIDCSCSWCQWLCNLHFLYLRGYGAHKRRKGRKEMFYLTTHSTHFIYGYMASDIW